MNRVVYERLRDIVPDKTLDELSVDEVDNAINVAFEIIGYNPQNLEEAVNKTWETAKTDKLFEYIYEVWRNDQ